MKALHDVHTATNDVLTGYREMAARGQPEIQDVVDRLTQMHERLAGNAAVVGLPTAQRDSIDSALARLPRA